MENGPLVSICIPIYNTEKKYLDETMHCVLNQTYSNIEIIFSDNCCTDNTMDIVRSYNDPRIKIFRNEKNMGHVYNFRKVLTYATGKYMKLLGADDGMALDQIEQAIKILESPEYQDVSLVGSYSQIINDESTVVYTKKFIFGGGKFSSYWGIRANLLYGSHIIGEPNGSLWRKDAYDKVPGEPKLTNGNDWTLDLDMHVELLLHGKLYIIPKPLGKFRISRQSTSTKQKFKQARLFKEYAIALYKDKRYKLSYIWVIIATVTSFMLQLARMMFYVVFIKQKKEPVR